jgi:hypothetical protein
MHGKDAYHWWPGGSRDRSLRAADHERDAVADILREEHLAGRIDSEELQNRMERCLAAKTYGQLDELIADLPVEEQMTSTARRWRWPAFAFVPLLIGAIALSSGRLFWLGFPLLFLFVVRPLLWHSAGRGLGWGWRGCPPRYPSRFL